jgi:hypothetical protein
MIQLITDEGHLFTREDSRQYIEYMLTIDFENFSNFSNCEAVKSPDYWGAFLLMETEEEYYTWIVRTAKRVLKE